MRERDNSSSVCAETFHISLSQIKLCQTLQPELLEAAIAKLKYLCDKAYITFIRLNIYHSKFMPMHPRLGSQNHSLVRAHIHPVSPLSFDSSRLPCAQISQTHAAFCQGSRERFPGPSLLNCLVSHLHSQHSQLIYWLHALPPVMPSTM